MPNELTSTPAIAVVVATRNRATRLGALLESLRAQTIVVPFEVIVVDDASTDETGECLAKFAGETRFRFRYVVRDRDAGPARARNEGWALAEAPLVAFTDDDCVTDPDWLAECLRVAVENRGAVVQGVTRPIPTELSRIGPFSHTRDVDGTGPWFETCNIVYPKELLKQLGGFDESFPEPLGEDTDLGWRALAAGAQHVAAPRALVFHAVDDLGLCGHLKLALRGRDAVLVFKRHPKLRRKALGGGILRNDAHLRLLISVAGVMLTQRPALRIVAAYPYARQLVWRCRSVDASPVYVPYFIVFDALSLFTTLRGDMKHRVFVI